jgi:hypothetical protein
MSSWYAVVSGADTAKRPPSIVVVLTQDDEEGGFLLSSYDRAGMPTLPETWHSSRTDATEWAASGHRPADLSRWFDIPKSVRDPVTFATRMAIRERV